MSSRTAARVAAAAWLLIATTFGTIERAQGAEDEDLRKAMTELTAKIKAYKGDKQKVMEAAKALDKELVDSFAERALQIHVIHASFGDIKNRLDAKGNPRRCNATAYFRGACEGKKKCPDDAAVVNGELSCGFDPAPFASSSEKAALVTYKCIRFGLRSWSEILETEGSGGETAVLRNKGRIICDPT